MSNPIFDAHLHIIDPAFPLVLNQVYRPDPFCDDDLALLAETLGAAAARAVCYDNAVEFYRPRATPPAERSH